jgi:hypothetical protein
VENFFNEVYNNGADKFNGSLIKSREALNYSYVSQVMKELIRNNFMGIPEKGTYKLTSQKKPDNTIIVTSIGKSIALSGNMIETQKQFVLEEINGEWQITDSYGLIDFYLNFEVEDTQWETYWDLKKSRILNEVKDNLKLEIINYGRPYFGNVLKGDLRLVNNSNYDVKDIEVLIEHFDENGVSVNTSNASVYNVIRSKGYREFAWYTSNCAKCVNQTFNIKFVEETIK